MDDNHNIVSRSRNYIKGARTMSKSTIEINMLAAEIRKKLKKELAEESEEIRELGLKIADLSTRMQLLIFHQDLVKSHLSEKDDDRFLSSIGEHPDDESLPF